LKLIGFSVWERRTGGGRNVTFPARQYNVNGERRSFALLRPIMDATTQDRIREMILRAYASYDSPGMHTRSLFNEAAELLTMDGGINLDRPNDTAKEATTSTDTTDQDLSPSRQLARDVATHLQELAQLPPEQVNPGVLLGTMTVEAIFGTKGPTPLARGRLDGMPVVLPADRPRRF